MATLKECRVEVHRLLDNALNGNGVLSADIYKFRTAKFRDEAATHVVVTTHKIRAEQLTQSEQLPYYMIRILVLARYNDKASEEAAEDALDNLEYLAVTTLADGNVSSVWEALGFLEGPERTSVIFAGKNYRMAQQLIKVEIN